MKRISVWMVLLLLCTLSTFAQNKIITVSGRVVESDTKQSAEQATIQLLALPDSTYTVGTASLQQGRFTLPKVKAGKYLLKISYVGFATKYIPVQLSNSAPAKNLGTILLDPDAVMLGEAVITAEAPAVSVVEDTLVYNSAAYRTPEGAMLEELVKKLPGAEIDDSGNVKINGKDVKKIMVDGKEFFGGDVKTGLKNLPVEMIEKLKTYDKKSDLARITGIDDGEEETVLDLTVKKGMKKGWFGNAGAAIGTEDRYSSNLMLNRIIDHNQFTIIGSANNVNDQGFSGGGGGSRGRRSNGLNASKIIGANFATETSKLQLGGSAQYNYNDADISSVNSVQRILETGNSYSNSNSRQRNKAKSFEANFRLEWKPDSMTNIIFRPNMTYGKGDNESGSYSGTFNQDPYNFVSNPNDYLDFKNFDPNADPLYDIRVNTSNSNSISASNSLSGNATLQLNRKLNNKGRNVTIRGTFGYGNNDNDQYSKTETRYYQKLNSMGQDSVEFRNQYITTPTNNYNYSAQITYSEPIARATFLQLSYNFQYKYSENDKSTFDLLKYPDWEVGESLPAGYQANYVDSLSKYAEYRYLNHDISVGLRFIREKYQLNAGVSLQPQHTELSYKKGDFQTDTARNIFNFAPNVDLRYRFSKVSQLRFTYNGRASQPGMESLLPTVDNSNPLNIRMGNPGLKPSFSHSMRMFYNTANVDRQRTIVGSLNFTSTQNSITNSTRYIPESGGTITRPENINGNWNASGLFVFNTALRNKKFTINTYSRGRYDNSVSFLYSQKNKQNDKNTSTELMLSESLNGSYRNDWFEFSLNSSIQYTWERSELQPEQNQEPYSFSYGASTNISFPWRMSLSTNIANNSRRGYQDASLNRNELIWNVQLSQTLLKGAGTISLEMYDILKQQSNISRSFANNIRSVSETNAINSYFMLRFIYRLKSFGGKAANEGSRRGSGGPDGPRSYGGGHGGGERRSF